MRPWQASEGAGQMFVGNPGNSVQRQVTWLLLAITMAAAALVVAPRVVDAQVAPIPLGSELTTTTSCLAGNGRVDTTLVNTTGATAIYRLMFQGLTDRQIILAPGDFGRIPITGRPDNTYTYKVTRDGGSISDRTVMVSCDGAVPTVSSPEATIINACRDSNGFITVQLANPTAASRPYVVEFDGVNNRSQTAAAFGAATRAVTGRPDGIYNMTVRTGASIVLQASVAVACDSVPGQNPTPTPVPPSTPVPDVSTPTPTPAPPPSAQELSAAVDIQCPSADVARAVATVTNSSGVDAPFTLVVLQTESDFGQIRSAIAAAGGSGTTSVNNLVAAEYRITVSSFGIVLFDTTQSISCAATPTPTPTVVPPPPVLNDDPVAADDAPIVREDDGAIDVTQELLANDDDPDSDELLITSIDTEGTVGEIVLSNGIVTYNPNGQFESLPGYEPGFPTGSDSFSYTVSDGRGGTASANVMVTIRGDNDAPIAVDDFGIATQGIQASVIDWWENDFEPDMNGPDLLFLYKPVRPAPPQPSAQGGTVDTNDEVLRYTSAPDFAGFDTFIYRTTDGMGGISDDVTLTMLVGTELPQPYELGTSVASTVARDIRENWFYFTLAEETHLSLNTNCLQSSGLEFRFIDEQNNGAGNVSCFQNEPRIFAPGTYAIRIFSDAVNSFDIDFTFSLDPFVCPPGTDSNVTQNGLCKVTDTIPLPLPCLAGEIQVLAQFDNGQQTMVCYAALPLIPALPEPADPNY